MEKAFFGIKVQSCHFFGWVHPLKALNFFDFLFNEST